MGQVNVEIGGRSYALSCRDGGEDHLIGLASDIATKADGLTRSLGAMSESRLLLMAALMVADELHDVRSGKAPLTVPEADPALITRLAALTERAEVLVARLNA